MNEAIRSLSSRFEDEDGPDHFFRRQQPKARQRERDTGGKNPQAVSAGAGETRLEQVHITQPGPTLGVPCRPGSEQPRTNQSLLVWQRFSSGEDEQFCHILFSQQGLSNDFCAKKLSCC